MAGPTTAYPTLPALEAAAAGGDVSPGDVIFVGDISAYYVVYPPLGAKPTNFVKHLFYPDQNTFDDDDDEFDYPDWTPGLIIPSGGRSVDVIVDPCAGGSVFVYSGAAVASYNLNGTSPRRPAPREEGSPVDVAFDAADLPDVTGSPTDPSP